MTGFAASLFEENLAAYDEHKVGKQQPNRVTS